MDEMQRVIDEAGIHRVLVQYCRGVDRGDEDLIAACYWPDSIDDHGGYKGSGPGFAPYVVKALNRHAINTQHLVGNVTIELAGAQAHVESYVLARHKIRREGRLVLETFGGRYADRFEKRGGEWRLAYRQVIHDWSNIVPITAEYPNEAFENGKRSREDITYRR